MRRPLVTALVAVGMIASVACSSTAPLGQTASTPRAPTPSASADAGTRAPTGTPTVGSQVTPSASPSQPRSVAEAGFPKPGTYRYAQTGIQTDGTPWPSEGTLVVAKVTRTEGTPSQDQTRIRRPGTSGRLMRLVSAGGLVLTHMNPGSGPCEFSPPLPFLPGSLDAGATWAGESTCERGPGRIYSFRMTGSVGASRSMDVGGERVRVVRIESSFVTTFGDLSSSENNVAWYSPEHGLFVRITTAGHGRAPDSEATWRSTDRLVSLVPDS